MKGNSSTMKSRGSSKGEIKREQYKTFLAYVEQRQSQKLEHECEQGRRREGGLLIGMERSSGRGITQVPSNELPHA